MVIDLQKIAIAFGVLVFIQVSQWFYFNSEIDTLSTELIEKKEILSSLDRLQNKWSKKNQEDELQRVLKFLSAFDIDYTLKETQKKKFITVNLQNKNTDRAVSFFINKSITIKKFNIKKIDQNNIQLLVEI
ncbi:MAG: hypothetical protein Q9M40_02495 [Sulfurimonas sp.]|nr:hypothetical protein [Sulfurimonas sp.]MDQ7066950.1 hypothetical protein [Sulfurimonas sp.]